MGVTRIFDGTKGKDETSEIIQITYVDDAAGGILDVATASRKGDGSEGYFRIDGLDHIVATIKNLDASPVTWDVIPKWKGTNDPTVVTPTTTSGFDLGVGDGKAVDQAYGATLTAGEEQAVVIDCGKCPRDIFLVMDPPTQNINFCILLRAVRKK